jgi:predicted nucleic acid-binding protein
VKYLLDTNVISEMRKSHCNQNVKSFIETIHSEDIYLSVITIGELCFGIEKLPAGKKKHELSVWLYIKLPEWFKDRIIRIDTETMVEWGKICSMAERTLPAADTLIAACAITNHFFLVTRNVKDFDGIDGINLINPWDF